MAFMFPIVMLVLNGRAWPRCGSAATASAAGEMQIGALIAFLSYLAQILMAVMMATFVAVLVAPRRGVRRAHQGGARHRRRRWSPRPAPVTELPTSGNLELRDVGFHYPGAEAPGALQHHPHRPPRPDHRHHRQHRLGQDHAVQPDPPSVRRHRRGRCSSTGSTSATSIPSCCGAASAWSPRSPTCSRAPSPPTCATPIPTPPTSELWEALEVAQARDFVAGHARRPRRPHRPGRLQRVGRPAPAPGHRPGRWSASPASTCSTTRSRPSTWPPTPACAPRWPPWSADATVLIVAQRVSTIMNADQILVLEDGRERRARHPPRAARAPVPPTPRSWPPS